MKTFSRALRPMLILVAVTWIAGFGSGERFFAPKADLWKRWTHHQAASAARIDFGPWTRFLKAHVRAVRGKVNRVTYGHVSAKDHRALKTFLHEMSGVRISAYNRKQQAAYWINLYNALTVDVVLDHYPVESIRNIDISPGLFASGPWGKKLISVEGEALSLNDIEHRILRPIWRDPRFHYALNCASVGCPDLQPVAYDGATLGKQLDRAARAYVNSPRAVLIRKGRVTVSRIYDWFIGDFGGTEASVIRHLKKYASKKLAGELDRIGKLHDTQYDWNLNVSK